MAMSRSSKQMQHCHPQYLAQNQPGAPNRFPKHVNSAGPARHSRAGRKRRHVSLASTGTRYHGLLSPTSTVSRHSDGRMSGDFSQLEWQSAASSTGVDDDTLMSSTSKLPNTDHALDPEFMFAILGDNYLLGNPTEHDFSKLFEAPWQDNQAATSSTTSLGGLSDITLSLQDLWGDTPAIRVSASDSDQTHCKLSESPLGMEWFGTIDTSPELSPSTSSHPSSSVDTTSNYAASDKAKRGNRDGCQCLSLVAGLIEQVETQGVKTDASIDDLLESCSEPLRQCKTLLDCPPCRSRSEYLLLLAILAKSLTTVFNSLVRLCVQVEKEVVQDFPALTNNWPDVHVGRHLVDDTAERFIVIEMLVAVKLNHLHQFLVNLKIHSKTREGSGALVLQVEERIRNLKVLMTNSQRQILAVNTYAKF
ncbi:hypothetical protein B0J13DRAFT_608596 [Dactylonectria estremocensis]|uniref:Aflatoxin regulatory protein domain-containing protein n=1 Tax=Dactylonectria estremocensis TaxID=1079267 RepID=A0A9P9EIG8_9HYPO|nr:hypothetical protein B0J13DRAFT_608596 [Dactylonectria estremocensis]